MKCRVSAKLLHPRRVVSSGSAAMVTNGTTNRSAPPPLRRILHSGRLSDSCDKRSLWAGRCSASALVPRTSASGASFFRFAGPIACSSRQRLRFAQPLARRRMAAQRFCRLLTLSDLISAISAPVLRSVIGSAPAPLRGSWCQQPRGAAVSAAMIAPCADEVLHAAVVARKPVFMRFRRGGGMVARVGAKLLHIAPTHPAARRCGSLTLPHRRSAPHEKFSAAMPRASKKVSSLARQKKT